MTQAVADARSEARWRALAEKAIGGPLGSLDAESVDGLSIRPLYPRRERDEAQPWRRQQAWQVAQRVDHPDPDEANRLALLDLEGGADGLTIVGAGSPYSRGFGLAPDPRVFDVALDTIELDLISIRLDAGTQTIEAAGALAKIVEHRVLTSAALALDLGFDPIGLAMRTGRPADADALRRVLDLHDRAKLGGRPLLADGRPSHEAGAGAAQELAAILATAVAYLRQLEALGLSLDAARRLVAILVVVDAEVLVSLAKVRAIRRLWARVETACGLESRPLRLHAETAWRMMTRYDPWINVMRATAGIFAAGLGGADVVTALPFTLALGLPDDGARRLARNAQRVLIDEAHLDAVDDSAAGSGGLEALTDELCKAAWALFQEIEREGGVPRALPHLAARIVDSARARAGDIAHLTRGLVGTSRFASLNASAPRVLDVPSLTPAVPGLDALPARRDAEPFEALRNRAEGLVAEGRRPRVFLATLETPAAFGPCANAAVNFFAAAGLAADLPAEERALEDQVAAFQASGTRVVCICAAKLDQADAAVTAFRHAGAGYVLALGRKGDAVVGADAILHDGCDAIAILGAVLDQADARHVRQPPA